MRPTNNIGYLLQHLAAILARQSDQALQEHLHIGFSQFKILMVLRNDPNVQQRFIAEALGQTEASISRQIKLLLNQRLLTSKKDPQNRRVHITASTAKGQRMVDEALSLLNSFYAPTFARLSDKQQQQLFTILNDLHEATCSTSQHPIS